jgi:hypothetical protein
MSVFRRKKKQDYVFDRIAVLRQHLKTISCSVTRNEVSVHTLKYIQQYFANLTQQAATFHAFKMATVPLLVIQTHFNR